MSELFGTCDKVEFVEELPYLDPNDPEVYYIVGISNKDDAFFINFPAIWEGYCEMGSLLDDNGFSYPEGLGEGVYKMKFTYTKDAPDWETGFIDGWTFDCVGEPELLFEYERIENDTSG